MTEYVINESERYCRIYDAIQAETYPKKLDRIEAISQMREELEISWWEYIIACENALGVENRKRQRKEH